MFEWDLNPRSFRGREMSYPLDYQSKVAVGAFNMYGGGYRIRTY